MLPDLRTAVPGPRSVELAARLGRVECRNTTFRDSGWPVFWESAEGVNVWDADGNRFLDLTSAFGVATLGHRATAEAAQRQANRLVHAMGDVHPARLKVELCERLSALTYETWTGRTGKTLLGNSGFEAVEAALKTAALATGRNRIVSFEGAYHGLGYGSLLGAGIPWFREPFEGQLAPVGIRLPYPRENNPESLNSFRTALAQVDGKKVSAVLVEPIQGRGGIVVPPAGFLRELRNWCDAQGALLIFDEIYTGFHRTGSRFACEREGVVPDLICLGKALSGGFPISACVGSAEAMDAWPETRGEALHTSTFLGNPIGCAMAIASLAEHAKPETTQRAVACGVEISSSLAPLTRLPAVHRIRGQGLMWGVELRHPDTAPASDLALKVVTSLLREGILLLPDAPEGHVLAFTPPITLQRQEMDHAVDAILRCLG